MSKKQFTPEGREFRNWWAVTDTGVRRVMGFSCAPNNPEHWWCPGVGYTLREGNHLFDTAKEALAEAVSEARKDLELQQKHLSELIRQQKRIK